MVIVFPMLVSQSVSENVIPGIAKTVEGYLIVNNMSDIMDDPMVRRTGLFKGFRATKGGWFAREGVELLEDEASDREELIGRGGTKTSDREELIGRGGTKTSVDSAGAKRQTNQDIIVATKERNRKKEEREERSEKRKEEEYQRKKAEEELKKKETKATAKVIASDYKSISLEPSYITVETTLRSGAIKRQFIGIKVVPYRVKSSEKLSRLILHDTQLNYLNSLMISLGRKVMRLFYSLLDKWGGRLRMGGVTMSGDPRRDIIMSRTGKKGLGIIVLDKNEDVDERFTQNISKLNRLFKMGWGNIIIADDISRSAYFCMRNFGGTCNVLNYSMMYQNLGQLKVYDSIEDSKRQNSSLFKVSTRASKVFSEWKVESKLTKYYISEDK